MKLTKKPEVSITSGSKVINLFKRLEKKRVKLYSPTVCRWRNLEQGWPRRAFFIIIFYSPLRLMCFYFYLYSTIKCDLPPLRPHCGDAPQTLIRTQDRQSRIRDTDHYTVDHHISTSLIVYCIVAAILVHVGEVTWINKPKFNGMMNSNGDLPVSFHSFSAFTYR